MILSYEYITHIEFSQTLALHNILLRCLPARETFQQIISESLYVRERFWKKESMDGFGNRIISGGTSDWHSSLHYVSRGRVALSTYCIPDAAPHPMYLLPAYTFTNENGEADFIRLTEEARCQEGLNGILRIMHFVHRYMTYCPGVTDVNTPLSEVIVSRKGVCQDYAHLMVALCRQAGYHARYVCGLMLGEGATHAWAEVHDGQCWYAFDPTNDTAIATGYIKLAHGRDAHDCPVSRGMYRAAAIGPVGFVTESSVISVTVTEE